VSGKYITRDRRYRSGYRRTPAGTRLIFTIFFWTALVIGCGIAQALWIPLTCAVLAAGRKLYRRHARRSLAASPARTVLPGPAQPLGECRARTAIPRTVKAAVWQRDGGRCAHCGITDAESAARTGVHLHYDHVVPFSRNGTDTVNNIQLLCEPCNLSKGNRYVG
jgi:hypothetical protein